MAVNWKITFGRLFGTDVLAPKVYYSLYSLYSLHSVYYLYPIALFCAVSAVMLALKTLPAKAAESEWQFTVHHAGLGDLKICVARHSFKMTTFDGLTEVTNGPAFEVCRYRPIDKVEWRAKLSEICGLNVFQDTKGEMYQFPSKIHWISLGTETRNGMACSKAVVKESRDRVFWFSEEMQVDPQVAELFCRTLKLPIAPKLPLYIDRITQSSASFDDEYVKKNTWLNPGKYPSFELGAGVEMETKSIKKVAFNALDFREPKGFKRVPRCHDIIYSTSQRAEMGELMEGLGFTPKEKPTVNEPSRQASPKVGH